jgi:hypothetical protein
MNVLTLPFVIMYVMGSQTKPIQRKYLKDTNNQNILGSTTIASLGEPFPVCQQVFENQMFQFQCPGTAVIKSIVAYYGQPKGSCTCPGNMQPDSLSVCKGTKIGATETSTSYLTNELNYKGQSCASVNGVIVPCFLGSTRFGIDCCSASLNTLSQADLNPLELAPNLQCNSYTAQYIADALCLNNNKCSFPVLVSCTYCIYHDIQYICSLCNELLYIHR